MPNTSEMHQNKLDDNDNTTKYWLSEAECGSVEGLWCRHPAALLHPEEVDHQSTPAQGDRHKPRLAVLEQRVAGAAEVVVGFGAGAADEVVDAAAGAVQVLQVVVVPCKVGLHPMRLRMQHTIAHPLAACSSTPTRKHDLCHTAA